MPASQISNRSSGTLTVNELEDSMLKCLAAVERKLLLVLDHADELLCGADTAADLRYFLQRLFESCSALKVLVSYCSSETGVRFSVNHRTLLGYLNP